jgi:hypothetical protein
MLLLCQILPSRGSADRSYILFHYCANLSAKLLAVISKLNDLGQESRCG